MTAPDDRADTQHTSGPIGGALGTLSREAGRATLFAVTTGLQVWERTRGVREHAVRRGGELLQIAAHTPLGRLLPQPDLDDRAEEEAERIAAQAREAVLDTVEKARTERPAPTPAPPAAPRSETSDGPSDAAVEAGAPGTATEQVEKVAGQLSIEVPQDGSDLPIPDFDNVSIGSLRARLRSQSLQDLVVLREWEQAHANRLPVVTLLDNRIAKVSAGEGATPGV
jgi:hypothetical protein